MVDREYRDLSDEVYRIDRLKGKDIKEGDKLKGKYKVLSLEDNQNNGMQAMEVTWINSVREVDTRQIEKNATED